MLVHSREPHGKRCCADRLLHGVVCRLCVHPNISYLGCAQQQHNRFCNHRAYNRHTSRTVHGCLVCSFRGNYWVLSWHILRTESCLRHSRYVLCWSAIQGQESLEHPSLLFFSVSFRLLPLNRASLAFSFGNVVSNNRTVDIGLSSSAPGSQKPEVQWKCENGCFFFHHFFDVNIGRADFGLINLYAGLSASVRRVATIVGGTDDRVSH